MKISKIELIAFSSKFHCSLKMENGKNDIDCEETGTNELVMSYCLMYSIRLCWIKNGHLQQVKFNQSLR